MATDLHNTQNNKRTLWIVAAVVFIAAIAYAIYANNNTLGNYNDISTSAGSSAAGTDTGSTVTDSSNSNR